MRSLFNCCTDDTAPDMTPYDFLIIGGCVNVSETDDETCIEGGQSADEAEFFTVYGHFREGGCDALGDQDTLAEAEEAATLISALYGLRIVVEC